MFMACASGGSSVLLSHGMQCFFFALLRADRLPYKRTVARKRILKHIGSKRTVTLTAHLASVYYFSDDCSESPATRAHTECSENRRIGVENGK
jgi:hypothetical protein